MEKAYLERFQVVDEMQAHIFFFFWSKLSSKQGERVRQVIHCLDSLMPYSLGCDIFI